MSDLFGIVPHDPGGRSKPKWPAGSIVSATFSGPNDCYRDELSEVWDTNLPLVMFLMMNPSVAGISHSDNTLRKTGAFARSWGFGGQLVANIHAYRATDSKVLLTVSDPVGPNNDAAILGLAKAAAFVVLAFGQPPRPLRDRGGRVVKALASHSIPMKYLRLADDGTPYHPLFLPSNLKPMDYLP